MAVPDDSEAVAGGLAVALQQALAESGGVWFGWSGKIAARPSPNPEVRRFGRVTFALMDLSRRDHREYYNGFANCSLWPLLHYRLDLADFSPETYEGYRRVNTLFADKVWPFIEPGDLVWVHDYHLLPMGEELRRRGVNTPMGFFLHTPLPVPEVFVALPHHRQLMQALCAYDLVGFHTEGYLRAFLRYVTEETGGEVKPGGRVRAFGRDLRAGAFPIGIDAAELAADAQRAERSEPMRRLRKRFAGRSMMIGVDRLDYSKGLPERFRAFERLLERFPQYQRRVNLMQIAPHSRQDLPEYMEIRRTLETMAGHINGRFAEFDWVPLHYLNQTFKRETLAGFYRHSRVGVVTPLRDGMNLVAKEFVAAQDPEDPGVLMLSRFAGAADVLHTALVVNPFDRDGMAEAMALALDMPLEERRERWEASMRQVEAHSITMWRDEFLAALRGDARF